MTGGLVSCRKPPVGYRMSGYFYERCSTGMNNPLQARAIVLQQGEQKFAWVFCDLLGVPSAITSEARTEAAVATGIPRVNIFVAATHCHTGPLYFGPLRDYFHNRAVELAGADEHEARPFHEELGKKLVDVVKQASANLAPTELAAGTTQQLGLAFNRRYVMRDGSVSSRNSCAITPKDWPRAAIAAV